jgi:hypothetical protein
MDELTALAVAYDADATDIDPETVARARRRLDEHLASAAFRQRRTPWRRAGRAGAGVAAVALLAAAGWTITQREVRSAAAFSCIAEGVTSVLPNDGTPPVEACQRAWEAGEMQEGVFTAPPLIACITEGAAVVVMAAEGKDPCGDAGMAPWSAERSFSAAGAAVRDARLALHEKADRTGDRCATEPDWREALRGSLEGPALNGWTTDFDRIEPGRSCYGLSSVDPVDRRIVFSGAVGNDSLGCDPRHGC